MTKQSHYVKRPALLIFLLAYVALGQKSLETPSVVSQHRNWM